jgi:MoxR-like ATPase
VSFDDVKAVALGCLRHRAILNFEGEAEGVTTDQVCQKILEQVPSMAKDSEAVAR